MSGPSQHHPFRKCCSPPATQIVSSEVTLNQVRISDIYRRHHESNFNFQIMAWPHPSLLSSTCIQIIQDRLLAKQHFFY